MSGEVELTNGEAERDVDAGFYELASLGDQVWLDANGDGINNDEEGIEGITVNLLDGNGNPTGESTMTDEDGFYSFDGLTPGDYIVEFIVPDGSELTLQDVNTGGGDDTNDSDADPDSGQSHVVTLESGDNDPTVDAGMYYLLSLGDLVWIDTDNDGRVDDGEEGIGFVDLALWLDLNGDDSPDVNTGRTALTNDDGYYLFENLAPGDYIVQVVPSNFEPGGTLAEYATSTGNDEVTDPDDDVNNDDDGWDLGIGIGITSKGITLRSDDEPIIDGDDDPNSNLTVDFGFFNDSRLGDYVWIDTNGDGIQDDDEDGINEVVVHLYDANTDALLATTETGENPDNASKQGYYIFENLVPGDYYVEFEIPEGYNVTKSNIGADDKDSDVDDSNGPGTTAAVTVAENGENLTVDAGLYLPAKVGNFVWLDNPTTTGDLLNVQDPSDTGYNGLTVNLYTVEDPFTPYMTTTTADDEDGNPGYYLFDDLAPGAYIVEFVRPTSGPIADWPFAVPNVGNDMIDSDVVDMFTGRTLDFEVKSGDCIEDIDAGFTQPVPVTWLYIRGEWNQDRDVNEISWATATEVNSDYYIVQRSYENGEFEDIGEVTAAGYSASVSEYNFDDKNIDRKW